MRDDDLGPKFGEVRSQYHSRMVPVYAVERYDTSFRLATREQGRLWIYDALSNPKAEQGSNLLDIGGKVSSISVTHWENPGRVLGIMDDTEEVGTLVRGLMEAPLKPIGPDYYGTKNHYVVVFRLGDGTAAARNYRTDTGRLAIGSISSSMTPPTGIVTPEALRNAIDEALEGYLKKQEALREATIVEEQRKNRT